MLRHHVPSLGKKIRAMTRMRAPCVHLSFLRFAFVSALVRFLARPSGSPPTPHVSIRENIGILSVR